jgi:hypothetical protein
MDRFAEWCNLLPPENTTLGLDEHTGIIMNFESGTCEVSGVSSVSLVRECDPEIYPSGTNFPLSELGEIFIPDPIEKDIPAHVWEMVMGVPPLELEDDQPSDEIIALAEQRDFARANKNWAESDKLRDQIAALGWSVQDSKDGRKLVRN